MSFLLTLATVLLSLYVLFQAIFFFGIMVSSLDGTFEGMYYLDDEGYYELAPFQITDLLIMPLFCVAVLLREKAYIKEWAAKNAHSGKYSNKFRKTKLQKAYDEAYTSKRKEVIMKLAKNRASSKHSYSPYTIPYEKALFQEEYLKALTGKADSKNILEERVKNLYAEESLEPVSDEVFSKLTEPRYFHN